MFVVSLVVLLASGASAAEPVCSSRFCLEVVGEPEMCERYDWEMSCFRHDGYVVRTRKGERVPGRIPGGAVAARFVAPDVVVLTDAPRSADEDFGFDVAAVTERSYRLSETGATALDRESPALVVPFHFRRRPGSERPRPAPLSAHDFLEMTGIPGSSRSPSVGRLTLAVDELLHNAVPLASTQEITALLHECGEAGCSTILAGPDPDRSERSLIFLPAGGVPVDLSDWGDRSCSVEIEDGHFAIAQAHDDSWSDPAPSPSYFIVRDDPRRMAMVEPRGLEVQTLRSYAVLEFPPPATARGRRRRPSWRTRPGTWRGVARTGRARGT